MCAANIYHKHESVTLLRQAEPLWLSRIEEPEVSLKTQNMLHYQEEPASVACQLHSLFNTLFATVKNENMETKAEFPQKWNGNLSCAAGNDAHESRRLCESP